MRFFARLLARALPLAFALPAAAQEPATRAWPVMGTLLEITVWETDSVRARAGLSAARSAVFRVDTLMSVYKPESELSVVNRRAGTDSVTAVSPETAAVLDAALRVAELTGGALDPTVGPLVDVWGFYRDAGQPPPPLALDSARALVGYGQVTYDAAARTLALPQRGMRLDFGAVAKGYAVDRALDALRDAGVGRALVDLGGNIGVLGEAPGGGGWTLGLRDPRNPEQPFAVVVLDSGALATSGDYEEFFVHEGVRYSHLFDPRTGWPVQGVASVTVVAPAGILSDALSTALFVLGPAAGCDLARRLPGIEAVWVRDADSLEGGVTAAHVVLTPGLIGRVELLLPYEAALAAPDDGPYDCDGRDLSDPASPGSEG